MLATITRLCFFSEFSYFPSICILQRAARHLLQNAPKSFFSGASSNKNNIFLSPKRISTTMKLTVEESVQEQLECILGAVKDLPFKELGWSWRFTTSEVQKKILSRALEKKMSEIKPKFQN